MGKYSKVRQKILSGTSDENISFSELHQLLMRLGFKEHIRGDHFIFTKEGIEEIINLQPKGAKAKAYQVKQVRGIMLKYRLGEQHVD